MFGVVGTRGGVVRHGMSLFYRLAPGLSVRLLRRALPACMASHVKTNPTGAPARDAGQEILTLFAIRRRPVAATNAPDVIASQGHSCARKVAVKAATSAAAAVTSEGNAMPKCSRCKAAVKKPTPPRIPGTTDPGRTNSKQIRPAEASNSTQVWSGVTGKNGAML